MDIVSDWTGRFAGPITGIARPDSPSEVSAILRRGAPVTTRAGNTSLVGGATPTQSSLLLDTTALRRLDPVDQATGQVTVGAGITLAQLQQHAAAAGWYYGVDLAARDSATVGGTVATNAGGIRVVRYGMTRAQVVGLEAVLANGDIIDDTSGLLKNNTGYSLSGLLVGSEGTLGIITAVRVALQPPPPPTVVALLPIPDLATGLGLISTVRRSGAELLAAETFDQASRDLTALPTGIPSAPWYLLIETTFDGLATIATDDLVVASDPAEQRRLWAAREGLTEAYGVVATEQGTVVQKFDVSLPSAALDSFVAAVRRLPATIGMFGHLADGNLHLEVIDSQPWDEPILKLVAEHRGSISAEHGIGQAKRDYLGLSRTPAEIAAMWAVKDALDPAGILNPGILLPPKS